MPHAEPRRLTDRLPRVVTEGEEGMISLVSLFAVMGLLIMFGALANVGRITTRKLETQNAADAVAHAAGVEMARGMNSVTTANHLIGELTGLCVIHHGFGGDKLDEGSTDAETFQSRIANFLLMVSYYKAKVFAIATPVPVQDQPYDSVHGDTIEVEAAIRDARIQLRIVLTGAYEFHYAGAGVYYVGLIFGFSAVGEAMMHLAQVIEFKTLQEWKTLDLLESMAKATRFAKKGLMEAAIPALQGYTHAVVATAPVQMEAAAVAVAEQNSATSGLYPGASNITNLLAGLPVEQEPARPQSWQKSQLVRATTPWVQYWREPWMTFGLVTLTLSHFAGHYEKRTDEYTRTLTDRLRSRGTLPIRLYVLPGWSPGGREKGRETWTRANGSDEADRMFCILGFAHRGPPLVTSYGIFRQTNPDGMMAYAQTMVYGANPQVPSPGSGQQPRLGWDTLHWNSAVREFPGKKGPVFLGLHSGIPMGSVEPRIKINWQTKLVPTTRLGSAWLGQGGEIGTVLRRTFPPFLPANLPHTH